MRLIWALLALGFVLVLVVWPVIKRVNRQPVERPIDTAAHQRLLREIDKHP